MQEIARALREMISEDSPNASEALLSGTREAVFREIFIFHYPSFLEKLYLIFAAKVRIFMITTSSLVSPFFELPSHSACGRPKHITILPVPAKNKSVLQSPLQTVQELPAYISVLHPYPPPE